MEAGNQGQQTVAAMPHPFRFESDQPTLVVLVQAAQ
jgi:hypothetical protein